MDSPTSPVHPPHADIAAAAERRTAEHRDDSLESRRRERELHIQFNRLIFPGIMRPNSQETALASLKILDTLSSNLLREPDNPKYQSFKANNSLIKRHLVDVKGALEYAVALGFHSHVEGYQQTYVFNKRHLEELRIGNAVLKEAIERESEKQDHALRALKLNKEAKEAAARQTLLAFEEDRRMKAERDRLEAQIRRQAEAASHSAHSPRSDFIDPTEPPSPRSGGHTLGGMPGANTHVDDE